MGKSLRACTLAGLGFIPGGENCAIEANLWLTYPEFFAVEYDTILHSSLYELDKVPVVPFWGLAVDVYVIMDGNDTGEMVSYLVHLHLEDVLAHLHSEMHAQELILPFVGLECCKVGVLLIQVYNQKAVLSFENMVVLLRDEKFCLGSGLCNGLG